MSTRKYTDYRTKIKPTHRQYHNISTQQLVSVTKIQQIVSVYLNTLFDFCTVFTKAAVALIF